MGIFSFLSTEPVAEVKDRRGARRQRPLFQASWRILGDRTNTYYPAEVKDVSATGIALYLPRAFEVKPGTIIMVQLDGVDERFSGPWLAQVLYLAPHEETILAGCAFSSPFKEDECATMLRSARNPRFRKATLYCEQYDPFVHGSQRERRRTPRRRGSTVAVHLWQNDDKPDPDCQALVLDRSVGGLALQARKEFTEGSLVRVRPCKAPEEVPWIHILIRHCVPKGDDWLLGCEFTKTPPTHVMLHFG